MIANADDVVRDPASGVFTGAEPILFYAHYASPANDSRRSHHSGGGTAFMFKNFC